MKLISALQLNRNQWNEWCQKTPEAGPFTNLEYLESTSENLLFVINAQNSGGLAIPYKIAFGIKTIYTPIFCRWIAWVGEQQPNAEDLLNFLKKHFDRAEIYTNDNLLGENFQSLIYQTIQDKQLALNQQVKRKLKKIEKLDYKISWNQNFENVIPVLKEALSNKFETLPTKSFPILHQLSTAFQKNGTLKTVSLHKDNQLVGGLLLIQNSTYILYLKGACLEPNKMDGGMYLLMKAAIEKAFEEDLNFDFGGSRIPGVQQFNKSFGGKDSFYLHYQWDNSPFWYKWLRKSKNAIAILRNQIQQS